MTGKVRLLNKGKRTIFIGPGQAIRPNDVVYVTPECAKKHLRLYPAEVVDLDNMAAGVNTGNMKDFTAPVEEKKAEPEKEAEAEAPPAKPAKPTKGKKGAKGDDAGDDKLAEALKDE